MFTIKAYTDSGRMIIREAESFTILTDQAGGIECTLHSDRGGERIDFGPPHGRPVEYPPLFQWAYIENAAGKTVHRIHLTPLPDAPPMSV
jgi:hypothetical protein